MRPMRMTLDVYYILGLGMKLLMHMGYTNIWWNKEKTTFNAFQKTKDVFEEAFINHNLKYQFKIEDGIETKIIPI